MTPGGQRSLGFLSLLSLGINGIVGVGIFFVPSKVAGNVPGPDGSLVYAFTGALLLPIAISYGLLGSRFDTDGGPYVWARAAFGGRVAFAVGWIAYVSALFSTAAVLAGLAEHAAPALGFVSPFARRAFALVCIATLAGVAATGLKPSAWTWSAVTVLKLVPLALLAMLPVFVDVPHASVVPTAAGASDVIRAALVAVFAMQGFEIVVVPAGHARSARWTVPMATVGALGLATVLYVLLHSACVRAVPELSSSGAPLVAAAAALGGTTLERIVEIGTNVSAVGIAFGMFAMTPRYLAVLGHPDAFGKGLSRESARGVPLAALAITALAVVPLVLGREIESLFALSSVAVLTQYGVSTLALVVLALRRKGGLSPRHAWPAPLALGAIAMVGSAARTRELAVAGGVLVAGLLLVGARRLWRRRGASGSTTAD